MVTLGSQIFKKIEEDKPLELNTKYKEMKMKDLFGLSGRTALVTGTSGNLGCRS